MTRNEFLSAAREYIGTPFHHQGRLKGVGVDCAGLVVCALQECNYAVEDVQCYSHVPSGMRFMAQVFKHCDAIAQEEIEPGDLMMFAFRSEPQHIAIVSAINPTMLLHGYGEVRRVCENHLGQTWQALLRGCYRLKDIE